MLLLQLQSLQPRHLHPRRPVSSLSIGGAYSLLRQGIPKISLQRLPKATGVFKQTVDYTTLAACAKELKVLWCPARVEQVLQYDNSAIAIRLQTLDKHAWLHVCWGSQVARLCCGEAPRRGSTSEAFAFGKQVHALLRGLVFTGVTMPVAWERVVQLEFSARPSEPPSKILSFELMARYSNMVLLEDGKILAVAYQVGAGMSRMRQLQAGGSYVLPPPAPGLQPSMYESVEQWRVNVTRAAQQVSETSSTMPTLRSGCVRAYQGVSPVLAGELCHAAGLQADADPNLLSGMDWSNLHQQWRRWIEAVETETFSASVSPITGHYSVVGTYPHAVAEGVHKLVDGFYGSLQATNSFAHLHQRVSSALRQAIKKLEARRRNFQQQMDSASNSDKLKKEADLIMTNLHRCHPGAPAVEVEDWETGSAVSLKLDPDKPPVATAEALYKQARKRRRSAFACRPLLEHAQTQVAYLREVEIALQQLEDGSEGADMDALQDIQEELVSEGFMPAPSDAKLAGKANSQSRKCKKRSLSDSEGFRQFTSPNGFQILVGRNNRQNDILTRHVARASDIWMHARGVPGAHVLLRVPPESKGSAQANDIESAADLAAWFSKARNEGSAPVTMVSSPTTNLRRPKGASPGQVICINDSTVFGRPPKSMAALSFAK